MTNHQIPEKLVAAILTQQQITRLVTGIYDHGTTGPTFTLFSIGTFSCPNTYVVEGQLKKNILFDAATYKRLKLQHLQSLLLVFDHKCQSI